MRKCIAVYLLLLMLACAAPGAAAQAEQEEAYLETAKQTLERMTLEQKVAQLFFVRPEDFSRISSVTEPDARLERAFGRFLVGGVVLFADNIKTEKQLQALTQGLADGGMAAGGIAPFVGVDEEGGSVARVSKKLRLKNPVPAMSEVAADGDPQAAYEAGAKIGAYLSGYGFTLDFAPVADVRFDVKNAEITDRSFGRDAPAVADMTASFVRGLQDEGVLAVLKHFPGHGSASGNSHTGMAVSDRTADEWRACEWLPFRAGIDAGARMVMISHQVARQVDAGSPASLSRTVVTEMLRGELGFDGVVITDALRMQAVSDSYGSGEACVRALEAGCDMLLLPKNFTNGYNGVMEAVEGERLTEERIDQSVLRILTLKAQRGLISAQR